MGLFNKFKNAKQYPPKVFAVKLLSRLKSGVEAFKDGHWDSRTTRNVQPIRNRIVDTAALDLSGIHKETAKYLMNAYLKHQFDLLGSGWVCNNYFSPSPGLEGHKYESRFTFKMDSEGYWLTHVINKANLNRSKSIIRLINGKYEFIDWQKDFKSGYRWSQKIRYDKQPVAHLPGVDIKVPWELARMQHLVQLAIFSLIFKEEREVILLEFRNQILDFIATNPPRWGANWVCTMDVGIRAANLLLAYDLLRQVDKTDVLDQNFVTVFVRSIYDHGNHIINNLEYSPRLNTNHYLANIAGLLFIAGYLEPSSKTDFWLAFTFQEIINEVGAQFYSDGGNFESSTAYHALSTQMVTWASALIIGLSDERKSRAFLAKHSRHTVYPFLKRSDQQGYKPSDPSFFPAWYTKRLYKAGQFLSDVSKPNGNIAQIGDNDSGKFFKLTPYGNFLTDAEAKNTYLNLRGYYALENQEGGGKYWNENTLNHQPVLAGLAGLFETGAFASATKKFPLEHSMIRAMSRQKIFSAVEPSKFRFSQTDLQESLRFRKEIIIKSTNLAFPGLLENLQHRAYLDSGIYVFRSDTLFLLVSASPIGQNNYGGHAHNDKLAVDLNIEGHDLAVDPGTYLYTPSQEWRNRLRSITAHATLNAGREQNRWTNDLIGLFSLRNESECLPLSCDANKISIRLTYDDVIQVRTIQIFNDRISIIDESNRDFSHSLHPCKWFSDGYGKLRAFVPDLRNFDISYNILS